MRRALDQGRRFRISRTVIDDGEEMLDECDSKYIDQRFLIRSIRAGDIKLLRGSWLVKHTGSLPFKRQQDLPPEAFCAPY